MTALKIITIASSLAPVGDELVIGNRQLARGQMLRDAQRGQQPRARVIVNAVESCACGSGLAIGQCGCGGPGPAAYAMAEAAASAPMGGYGQRGPDVRQNGDMVPPSWYDRPGCYPRGATFQSMREAWRSSRMSKCPYMDPRWDSIDMDYLYSNPTIVSTGVTQNLEVSPAAGTFLAFYYSIIAVDPATQVSQVDWRAGQPRVEGCPVPCQTDEFPALSQYVLRSPEGCCGQPGVFWLDTRAQDIPLLVPVTNNSAGDLLFQVQLRGYCCNTRIC